MKRSFPTILRLFCLSLLLSLTFFLLESNSSIYAKQPHLVAHRNMSPNFTPFVGIWYHHGAFLQFNADGHVNFQQRTYQMCSPDIAPPCDTFQGDTIMSGNRAQMSFTQVSNATAYGLITSSTYRHIGYKVSLKRAPDDVLELTEGSDLPLTLCGPNAPIGLCGA